MRSSGWLQSLGAAVFLMLTTVCVHADERVSEDDFLVFVGQKISVEEFKLPECDQCVITNQAFHAHYRVVLKVYGAYQGADIRFDAFDHYGWPAFAEYEHVLLFARKGEDGKWYHEKYQYFPVYETQDDSWAACGSANQFEHPSLRGPSTARRIAFKNPVIHSLPNLPREDVDAWFPPSDWHHVAGKAICMKGTPLAELFEAKKHGVLKARGLFE